MRFMDHDLQEDIGFVAKLFLVFVGMYFSMATVMPLTIDAEFASQATGRIGWVQQGRWATYLLELVLFRPVVPWFTIAFFGGCAAIAFTILLRACELRYDYQMIGAFAVFVAFPVWSTILEFPANTTSVALALIACTVAASFHRHQRFQPILFAWQVALVTFAIGSYQIMVFVYAALALCVLYFRLIQAGQVFRDVGLIICVAVASIAVHYLIQIVFLKAIGLPEAYIGIFFQPALFINDPVGVTLRSADTLLSIYLGATKFFGASLWAAPALIVVALIVAARRSPIALALLVAALLTPAPMILVAGGFLPIRTLLSASVALGVCAMVVVSAKGHLRWVGASFVVILALQSAAAISQYQAQRDLIAKFDHATAAAVYNQIAAAAPDPVKTVDFFGSLNPTQTYPVIPTSTASGSFFSWDGGNPWRMLAYMKLVGYSNLHLAPWEIREANKAEFLTMSVWPAIGSVRKVGDVVLVKFGETQGL